MNLTRKIGKTLTLIKRGNFRLILSKIHEKRAAAKDRKIYNLWLKKHAALIDFDRRQIREKIENFETARQTIKNFTENTDYQNFEIVLIGSAKFKNALENQSFSVGTKIIVCENQSEAGCFNFAAAQTFGEILCFVDANLKPLSADWLKELISFACQTEIGAVGAKLLSADEKILHG